CQRDQAMASTAMSPATKRLLGLRPPVSACATISSSSSVSGASSVVVLVVSATGPSSSSKSAAGGGVPPAAANAPPREALRGALLLQPALLLVVALRTFMQRRREAILHHAFGREVGECRMQALELVEVLEHRLHDLVDRIGRHLRGGDQGRQDTVGLRRLRIVRVQAAGDRRLGIVGLALEELVDLGPLQRNELRATGRRRILDVGARMPDSVEEAVDLAVAERGPVLVGLQLGREREVADRPAEGVEQLLHRRPGARARVAHIEALALEVGELLDAGLL